MIKTRVIPLLLVKDGLLKKPLRFTERPRTVANALSLARVFESRQVDELILLDIGNNPKVRNLNSVIVRQIADNLTVPLTCGGGIRDLDTMRDLIAAGAEKVTLNTAAVETPELITRGAELLGRQCVVVSIDAKRGDDGRYEVFTHSGRQATGLDPAEWARKAAEHGAGEILINSIDRDGTMEGYNTDLIAMVSKAVRVPVIAAGGAGKLDHFVDAVVTGKASAVAAGSIFFFRQITPMMVKGALAEVGVPVRIPKEIADWQTGSARPAPAA